MGPIKEINKDYIIITEITPYGLLATREILIKHRHTDTINNLNAMMQNPNKSILDMQDVFFRDSYSGVDHHVCLLKEYNESYIKDAIFPKRMSHTDYKNLIDAEISRLAIENEDTTNSGENQGIRTIDDFTNSIKSEFFDEALRYIASDEYVETYFETVTLNEYQIISTENIGWSTFEHRIGERIKFSIRTNFGYGRASYFYIIMQYCGIPILPYADLVNYPYANMHDLIRATCSYTPIRDNWHLAMDFVVKTANLASMDRETFVKEWIKNEVDEMMAGLRNFHQNLEIMIKRYTQKANSDTMPFISVRNFTESQVKLYSVTTNETNVSWKATKFSSALMFLDNLQKIAKIFGYVDNALIELKSLAMSIIPEIEAVESALTAELSKMNNILESERVKLDNLNKKIKPFNEELNSILKNTINLKSEVGNNSSPQDIKNWYSNTHPEYKTLYRQYNLQNEKVYNVKNLIQSRTKFHETLCKQRETIICQTAKII